MILHKSHAEIELSASPYTIKSMRPKHNFNQYYESK